MRNKEVLEKRGVDVKASLEFWGDMESYEENLKELRDSLSSKLDNILYYKNNQDWSNYAILAHSIKSEAKYLGFMKEAEVFLAHELSGKESNGEFINANFEEFKKTVQSIIEVIDEYFGGSSKKNILIVDDSNIVINFIDKNISEEFNSVKANNGKEALNIIENNEVYAIMLDLNMPSLNGFEVLDYLKSHDLIEKIPVVVITGDDTEDTIKKAFSYPILDVINKPFNDENIRRVLVSIKSFYDKH